MTRRSTAAIVLGTLLMLSRIGGAATDVEQFCWQLTPSVDTLRLAVTRITGEALMFQLQVTWRAKAAQAQQTVLGAVGDTQPATYQLLGTGTARESVIEPGQIDLGIVAVRGIQPAPPAFPFLCHLSARVSLPSLSGPWVVSCLNPALFGRIGTLVALPDCRADD